MGSNRTFMELKYDRLTCGIDEFSRVLIVPLWN